MNHLIIDKDLVSAMIIFKLLCTNIFYANELCQCLDAIVVENKIHYYLYKDKFYRSFSFCFSSFS